LSGAVLEPRQRVQLESVFDIDRGKYRANSVQRCRASNSMQLYVDDHG
jgi:hypothetical protein